MSVRVYVSSEKKTNKIKHEKLQKYLIIYILLSEIDVIYNKQLYRNPIFINIILATSVAFFILITIHALRWANEWIVNISGWWEMHSHESESCVGGHGAAMELVIFFCSSDLMVGESIFHGWTQERGFLLVYLKMIGQTGWKNRGRGQLFWVEGREGRVELEQEWFTSPHTSQDGVQHTLFSRRVHKEWSHRHPLDHSTPW